MREKTRAIDMTKGNVLTVILSFAIPIFIGNIFQQLYNVVDTVVIGNVLGKDVPDNCVVGGVPAHVIKQIEDDVER